MPSLAGSFLVSAPKLLAPAFRRSVVLILRHDLRGAWGLVTNRPATENKGLPFVVYGGGPCPAQGLLLLHGHPDWTSSKTVAPGIFVGDFGCLKKATDSPDADYRFRAFTGCACWDAGQLESEVAGGAWTVVPASGGLLFDTSPADLWDVLRPPKLPVAYSN